MKFLFITPRFPDPASQGYLNIAQEYIKILSKRHQVDLYSLEDRSIRIDTKSKFADCLGNIWVRPVKKWKCLLRLFRFPIKLLPIQALYYYSPELIKDCSAKMDSNNYDCIVVFLSRLSWICPEQYRRKAILFSVDPLVKSYTYLADHSNGFNKLFYEMEKRLLALYESENLNSYKKVLMIAEKDKQHYEELFGLNNIDSVPYGTHTSTCIKSFENREREVVVSGQMSYFPNRQGIDYLLNEVWPRVYNRNSDIRLKIIGKVKGKDLNKYRGIPGVYFTGFVRDLHEELSKSRCFVCPVLLEAGAQTKVLDAMHTGTPVVSTVAGNNGIQGEHSRHLYVERNADDIAERVLELMDDRKKWEPISKESYEFVRREFNWNGSVEKFERIAESIKL